MCMPSEKFTTLLEFCYNHDKLVIEKGKKKKEKKEWSCKMFHYKYGHMYG